MSRARVVILGAGFGGIECAKKLDGGPTDVLIVDRNNYHLFTPLLYQVASALLNPSDIAYPIRRIFSGSPNVRVQQAEVVDVDLDARALTCADGSTIAYDRLVVAAGSTTNYFGNEAIETRSLGLKNLGEALQLRNHILSCLELASRAPDRDVQQALMTFIIVGAGPTGVEFAGALAELMRLVLPKEYPQITVPARILLAEGQGQVLGAFPEKLGNYTERRLGDLGVEVRLETLVDGAEDGFVVLKGGERIPSHTLVWSAGVQPAEIAALPSLPQRDRSRRIAVDGHLRVAGHPEVFAIGDVAGVEQDGAAQSDGSAPDGTELPMLSAPAMQQGRYVADFILAHLGGAEASPGAPPNLAPFRYVDKGTMATIGRNAAVCQTQGIELTGWLGWMAWLVVHIYYLIGFRNRLVVLWSWAYNYIFYDRPVRIIAHEKGLPKLPQAAPRVVPGPAPCDF